MNLRRVLVYELLLILSSVFIFRGLWGLLDRLEFMHHDLAQAVSLVLGLIVTVIALVALNREIGKKH